MTQQSDVLSQRTYEVFNQINNTINRMSDEELRENIESILNQITSEARELMGQEWKCALFLVEPDEDLLTVRARSGLEEDIWAKIEIKPGESITGKTFESGEMQVIPHVFEFGPKYPQTNKEAKAMLSRPVYDAGKPVGVFNVYLDTPHEFASSEIAQVDMVVSQAELAISRARRSEALEQAALQTIYTLVKTMGARSPYTREHMDRVGMHCQRMGTELDLPREKLRNIRVGGRLHDIGKLGIGDDILYKAGKLTEEEREKVVQHPQAGVDIIKGITHLEPIVPLIQYHHERMDGQGYFGLSKEEIPLGARIIAVADTFDTMTDPKRPYNLEPKSQEQAIEEIKNNAGTQFDPEVVQAFLATQNHSNSTN